MKKVFYCLVLATLFSITTGYGQGRRDTIPRQVARQIQWMEKQGFPAREYRWGNSDINQHLQQALAYRKQSIGYLAGSIPLISTGIILGVAGMLGVLVSVVQVGSVGSDDEVDVTRYAIMGTAGLAVMSGGIVLTVVGGRKKRKAQQELRIAKNLY